jgi:hypothetical protein
MSTVFSPISIAGMLDEVENGSILEVEQEREADWPSGSTTGGGPPKPLLTPPQIQGCNAQPNPSPAGGPVNITCMIQEDIGLASVWVEITDPDGQTVGNFSMQFDQVMFWYYEANYFKAGLYLYAVTAEDVEGLFDWDNGFGSWGFVVEDFTPPSIANETATPSPQEIGQNVNITCDVIDNGEVSEVWVEVYDPLMSSVGNFSMVYDSGTGNWSYEGPYSQVGLYSFTITAWDSGGNFDVATGNFIMEDTTPPAISSPQEDPNPQQTNDFVNISALVTDLGGVSGVWLNVVDPGSNPIGNWSMDFDSGTGRYYYNRTYIPLGIYTYEIWARDSNGNWNFYSGTFEIVQDVTPPTISGETATPNPQEVFFDVNIAATITDNSAVFAAWVEVIDPLGGLVGNFSMSDAGGGLYEYQQAYTMLGTYTFTIWANDTYDIWSSAGGSFTMVDTTLPVVDQITAIPDPQEVFLQVNVSCRVTDNYGPQEAWLEVRDPLGALVGNFSMVFDIGTGRWSHVQAYSMIGTYTFTIWAADSSGNWGTNSGSFLMEDTTPPLVTGTVATPNPQESNSNVNITATVTDNYQVFEAYVEVIDPFAVILGNFTMQWDAMALQFYYEQSYWELGDYDYTIWASDTSNNWDSAPGSFTIIDTTDPFISDVQRIPQPQEVHLSVNVSAIVTDNYQVQQVIIDIMRPIGGNEVNTDMFYDSVNGRYYYTANYDMVGMYTCNIWAADPLNNQILVGCDFTMVDTTLPVISAMTNVPNPGEVNAPVNMSANITDNYQVDASNVWINIMDPFAVPIGNFSMLFDSVNGRFYYERSFTQIGIHSFTIWAADVGGLWESAQRGFMVDDTTPPVISGVAEIPDPQEVYGLVNISADIIDNYQMQRVDVNILNQTGVFVGNFSMNFDTGSGRYYYEATYDTLGTYTCTIWAIDISSNAGSGACAFLIQDTTPPLIQNTVATPDPQDAGSLVRIDTQVTDNFQLGLVYVEVFNPFLVSVFNTTMTVGPPFSYEQAYTELGIHTFTITAWDSVGLFSVDTGSFVIYDISPPILGIPTEAPDPQEVFGTVNVTVDVSDNYLIQRVDMDILDPSAGPVGNFSMIDLGTGMFSYEQAYDLLGTYTCTIWAVDTSGNSAYVGCSFQVQDTTNPIISGVTEDPQPQNVGGNVNVSAIVTDNFQVTFVRIEIIDPNTLPLGNNTMLYDAGTGRYYYDSNYVTVGTYSYNIFAWDSSSNSIGYSGTFQISDLVLPTIASTQAQPDPQEVFMNVRISATISDNIAVFGAWVEVSDPFGGVVGNFSMTDSGGVYYYDQTYDMLETYTFIIRASDVNDNWAMDSGSFVIVDTTPPDISNILTTSPQEVDVGSIDINATVSDIFDATIDLLVWITVMYPNSTLLENVSMTYDIGNDEFTYQKSSLLELGTYDFEIFASDTHDNLNSVVGSFVIEDTQDPVADAGIDQSLNQGVLVTFDGSGSSDNDPLFDTTSNYTWTFLDLGAKTIYEVGPTYTFVRGGDYVVTLRVTDRAGNTATDTVNIHVIAGPSPPLNPRVTDPTESTLTISWDPPATYTDGRVIPGADIKGYTIYRAASSDGPYTELTFVTALTYTDTGLANDTTYYYKITCWSVAEDIESEMTNWKSGVTTTVTSPPPDDGDGDGEQDMMLYVLLLMLIVVIVVIAIVAVALLRRKKPAEEVLPPEEYEDEYYYDDDLPPPPPA